VDFTVRTATPADGPAIAEVQLAAWRATYAQWIPDAIAALDPERTAGNWARAAARPDQRVWVAERDRTVVGYVHSGPAEEPQPPTADQVEIYALYVHPDAQGAGIGRALVEAVLASPDTEGRECVLWALERYVPALRFYAALGFRVEPGHTRPWRGMTELLHRRPVQP